MPLYVVDPAEWKATGTPQRSHLIRSLRALGDRIGGLLVLHGDPREVVPELATRLGGSTIFASADLTPYGRDRDEAVSGSVDASWVIPEPSQDLEIHEPWLLDEPPAGYPPPLVDHAEERLESLARYDEIRSGIR